MERFCGSQNRALIFAKTLSAYGGSVKSHNSPQRMETTQTKTKCVLYARKSTEEDDQQIMSIEAQLLNYANMRAENALKS